MMPKIEIFLYFCFELKSRATLFDKQPDVMSQSPQKCFTVLNLVWKSIQMSTNMCRYPPPLKCPKVNIPVLLFGAIIEGNYTG